jgi:alpha-beta hydrolase superfamily lysophospholipase
VPGTGLAERYTYPELSMSRNDEEREAALRQFPMCRLLSYGVEFGDATRLLDLVGDGRGWQAATLGLADVVLAKLNNPDYPISPRSSADLHRRASALLRLSYALELKDTREEKAVYQRAVDHYRAARKHDPRFEEVLIPTKNGPVYGWTIKPQAQPPAAAVMVMGGAEGWALAWEEIGIRLSDQGIAALMIDGPGQGATRLVHGHFMDECWLETFDEVTRFLADQWSDVPLGLIGNSMAGSLVTHIAARYRRFEAVVNNGGPVSISTFLQTSRSWALRIGRLCRPDTPPEKLVEIFRTVDLIRPIELDCPYLIIHGEADPVVSMDDVKTIQAHVTAPERKLVLFEQGEHTVSKFPADKFHVIENWLSDRLKRAERPGSVRPKVQD